MPPLTANMSSTLTQILALTDALWTPHRRYSESDVVVSAAVWERREAFAARGVPLVVAGGGTERLAGERELQRLAADGLIRLHHRGKRIGVALTDRGDDVARAMVAGYTARESFKWLKAVERARAKNGGDTNCGFTLEADIVGTEYGRPSAAQKLGGLELEMLPLLCRGWMESWTDTKGRIGYRVSNSGLTARRPRAATLPKYDHVAGDEYDLLFAGAIADRNAWKPTTPSLVVIALSAGLWPAKMGAVSK